MAEVSWEYNATKVKRPEGILSTNSGQVTRLWRAKLHQQSV